jgi:hypothetical protein
MSGKKNPLYDGEGNLLSSTYVEPESGAVADAKRALSAHLRSSPTYTSQWSKQIEGILGDIENRGKFTYDVNGDAFYQQYKDKFTKQGKLASADVMGQAAAMTGGYGNSYAATVGNQAYQAQLGNLNNIIPELYQMAYDRYEKEGQDLYNKYSLYADREKTEYNKYRDEVADWQNTASYLQSAYDSERDLDYANWADNYSNAVSKYNALIGAGYVEDENGNMIYSPQPTKLTVAELQTIYDNAYNYALDGGEEMVLGYLEALEEQGVSEAVLRGIYDAVIPRDKK